MEYGEQFTFRCNSGRLFAAVQLVQMNPWLMKRASQFACPFRHPAAV